MGIIKKNIPNLFTLANLMCGLLAIHYCYEGMILRASYLIFFGSFLDFLDGFTARLLNVSSLIGKQLDSFADLVNFGVAPGFIMIYLINNDMKLDSETTNNSLLSFSGFVIPFFSAIRLAKFNTDDEQKTSFIGLPTPVLAIFIASLPILRESYSIVLSTDLLISTSIILSFLLVSNLNLFSLKISKTETITSQLNVIRIIFLTSCIILLLIFHFVSIPFIVILYIILSIINNLIK